MDIDLRKTATDAGYIAVGAGVLGFQQAQVRRRDAQARIQEQVESLGQRASTLTADVRERLADPRAGLDCTGARVRTWVEPILGELRTRMEPTAERVRDLPGKAQDAAAPVADAIQSAAAPVTDSIKGAAAPVADAIKGVPERVKGVQTPVMDSLKTLPERVKAAQAQAATVPGSVRAVGAQLGTVPEPVRKAVDAGRERVRSLRGGEAATA